MNDEDLRALNDRPPEEGVKVGLIARSRQRFMACKPVLEAVGAIKRLRDLHDIRRELNVDLLIVEVDLNSAQHIHSLKACRDHNPILPIIMMARGAEPDVVSEICLLLRVDFLSAPHQTDEELRLKCYRGLFGRKGPTLQRPSLAPLLPKGSGMGMDRRKVYRASVPSSLASTAHAGLEPPVAIDLVDISIPYEGHPGGMLFQTGRDEAQAIVKSVGKWGKGARIDLYVQLAGEEEEISVACVVVRVPRPRNNEYFHFAVEYHADTAKQEAALMRFWTNCQLRERRTSKVEGSPTG